MKSNKSKNQNKKKMKQKENKNSKNVNKKEVKAVKKTPAVSMKTTTSTKSSKTPPKMAAKKAPVITMKTATPAKSNKPSPKMNAKAVTPTPKMKYKFKLGDKVQTTAGNRRVKNKKFKGTVVGFGTWREFKSITVLKNSKSVTQRRVKCLEKNLIKVF